MQALACVCQAGTWCQVTLLFAWLGVQGVLVYG